MKVLFGYLTYSYRGGSKFQLEFAGNFRESTVGFITSNAKVEYEDEVKKIGRIYRIPPTKSFLQRLRAMKILAKEYDVLYLNKAVLNPFELYIVKKSGFKKVVFHSHADRKDCRNSLTRAGYHFLHSIARVFINRVADKKCACSIPAAKWLFGENNIEDVTIVKNGIDLSEFRFSSVVREKKRKELGICGFCILHVGSFTAVKNQGYLVDAFATFHERYPDSVLLLVGEGELLESVRRKVTVQHLEDSVYFLGYRDDVAELMQAADLFVLPSLSEGFSYVSLEAQAAGLPCIISSAVPSEALLSADMQSFDVSLPHEKLAEVILAAIDRPRLDMIREIYDAGYDLKSCAIDLEENLKQLLCEK